MNDNLICNELAAVLSANAPLLAAIPNIHGPQSGEVTERPTLTISGAFESYGPRRKGSLVFELLSRLADETTSGHSAQFSALFAALFGTDSAPVPSTAVITAVNARNHVTLFTYGLASKAIVADVAGEDLRTVLTLNVVWQFV